jgi:hypothetical protein
LPPLLFGFVGFLLSRSYIDKNKYISFQIFFITDTCEFA